MSKDTIELGEKDAAFVVRTGEDGTVREMELILPDEGDDPSLPIDSATMIVLTAAYLMKDMEVEQMEELLEKVFNLEKTL